MGGRSENKYPPNERGNWRTRLRVLESRYFPIGTSEVERYLCPSLNSKGRAIFCPRRHPLLFRLRSVGRRTFTVDGKINIISSVNSFNAVLSQVTDTRYKGLIRAERTFFIYIGILLSVIATSTNTATSQLAAISCTSKRPISERLHQLEHSKDENVSLQSISALRSSLRVHSPHPRPLISLFDKLDYTHPTHILYPRLLPRCSFTQNWIIAWTSE